MVSNRALLAVIGHLYDAATDLDKWPAFFETLGELFDAPFTNLLHFDQEEHRFSFWLTGGRQLSENMREHFQIEFTDDPRLIAANQLPGKPLSCRLSIGEEAWDQSTIYKNLILHSNQFPIVEYSLTVTLPEQGRSLTGLAIMRWRDGGAFRQDECDLLGEIIPHLK